MTPHARTFAQPTLRRGLIAAPVTTAMIARGIRNVADRLPYFADGLWICPCIPVLAVWFCCEELQLWIDRADLRRVDRVLTFGVTFLLIAVALYLLGEVLLALHRHPQLF